MEENGPCGGRTLCARSKNPCALILDPTMEQAMNQSLTDDSTDLRATFNQWHPDMPQAA